MAKKKHQDKQQHSSSSSSSRSFLSLLGKLFSTSLTQPIKAGADEVFDHLEHRLHRVTDRLVQRFARSALSFLGWCFVIAGTWYFLRDEVVLAPWKVFLYLGVVLLILSLYLRYRDLRNERHI